MTNNNGTVGRKRKKNGFTQIANSMFEDSRLSWRAKGLLGYLLSRPNNWKINKTDLYRKATEGRDAMQGALNELKELGYLHIYHSRDDDTGLFKGWIWEYDDTPFTREVLENDTTENKQEIGENDSFFSCSENKMVGKGDVQFSSRYNNKDYNNKDFNNNKDKEIKTIKTTSGQLEKEFEAIWLLYPRKIGKKKSFDSFKKARKVKKIPYETIQNGLYRYIRYLEQQGTDEQYIMHGATWFNQEKWQDEYILTGINKQPKNINEYMRQKYGGEPYEPSRDRKIINSDNELLSELF